MTKKTPLIGLVILTLLVFLAACQQAPAIPDEEDIDGITDFGPLELPNFDLVDQHGNPVQLSDFQGKLVLLYFGFTHCPDFCPATMNDYKLIKRELGDEAANEVVFLFVSVDPERDTPEVLDTYVKRFDPSFVAVSGEEVTLQKLTNAFGTTYEIDDHQHGESYAVAHPSSKFLLNREGKVVTKYSFGIDFAAVAEDLRGKL